ncbi:MAG TPA: polysaccharide biosynthesis/export family protein, partial [Chloroflexota bacterium]
KDDRLRPGDLLDIRVPKTYALPDASIKGVFQVEASGKVALGPGYGRREVKGLTLEEAEEVIQKHLSRVLKDPVVSVTRPVPAHSELERRIQQLEMEVRTLRALVEELRKKARD